ncbi:MAG: HAD-IC family P-type ATPase, partial [bacterium]
MQFRSTGEFSSLSIEEAFKELESSPQGLSEEEAKARLSLWGYNEVPEKRTSPVVFFLTRFWGPMPWLLEIAILFSFLLGRTLEGALISFLLLLNAIIGFWHRWNSTKTVELLKKKLQVSARILRDGEIKIREARELVPGDVVHLKQGDLVPADLKVFQGEASVDQSAITGESLPVSVKEGGILYSGSILKRGELKALVLNTGTRSFYGTSLELVRIAQPKS